MLSETRPIPGWQAVAESMVRSIAPVGRRSCESWTRSVPASDSVPLGMLLPLVLATYKLNG